MKRGLTTQEQKTTAAFKLMADRVKTLERSLKITQDELEKYRDKYHEADKNSAVAASRNDTLIFHEVLKFFISIAFGGIGVNLITSNQISKGVGIVITGVVLYSIIAYADRQKT